MPLSRHLRRLTLLALFAVAGTSAWAAPQARHQAVPPVQPVDRSAQDRQDRPPPGHDRRDDQRALSDAVRRAERATRGQVLSAERVQYDGRDLNRVKVVDDRGRVRVYWDDPQSQQAPPGDEKPRARRTHDDDGDSD